jgi:hypothetical protein
MNGDVEREEIEKLLPWYVTGRLDGADRSKVESYLSRHSAVAAQLDFIHDEREETVNVNEAAGYPPPDMLQRLTASLPEARFRSNDFLAPFLTIFTAPTTRSVRWAALVAGMIVIAQAGVIAGLLLRIGEHTYQEAAGSLQAVGSFSALVVFSDEATATSIMRLLGEFNANIVDGPKPGGIYKIRLPASDRSSGASRSDSRCLAGCGLTTVSGCRHRLHSRLCTGTGGGVPALRSSYAALASCCSPWSPRHSRRVVPRPEAVISRAALQLEPSLARGARFAVLPDRARSCVRQGAILGSSAGARRRRPTECDGLIMLGFPGRLLNRGATLPRCPIASSGCPKASRCLLLYRVRSLYSLIRNNRYLLAGNSRAHTAWSASIWSRFRYCVHEPNSCVCVEGVRKRWFSRRCSETRVFAPPS